MPLVYYSIVYEIIFCDGLLVRNKRRWDTIALLDIYYLYNIVVLCSGGG